MLVTCGRPTFDTDFGPGVRTWGRSPATHPSISGIPTNRPTARPPAKRPDRPTHRPSGRPEGSRGWSYEARHANNGNQQLWWLRAPLATRMHEIDQPVGAFLAEVAPTLSKVEHPGTTRRCRCWPMLVRCWPARVRQTPLGRHRGSPLLSRADCARRLRMQGASAWAPAAEPCGWPPVKGRQERPSFAQRLSWV